MNFIASSKAPPWADPKAIIPAATPTFREFPPLATALAAITDGGAIPWSITETKMASIILASASVGSSPFRIRYMAWAKLRFPTRSRSL